MRPVEAIVLVLSILFILSLQLQHQQFVFYRILCEYWLRELSSVLFITLNRRARRRRLRRLRRIPYAWTVPRPLNSWFELHYHDRTIPEEYFRQQLRMKKDTFDVVLNLLGYRLVRQDTRFRGRYSLRESISSRFYIVSGMEILTTVLVLSLTLGNQQQ